MRASPPLVIKVAALCPVIWSIMSEEERSFYSCSFPPARAALSGPAHQSSSEHFTPPERPSPSVPSQIVPRSIPDGAKSALKIIFIAKHALWDGGLHPEDGNHAPYHVEVRDILEGLGLRLELANRYDALFDKPDVDFVFPLLNRGGFLNSEMMLPLLATRHGLPFLGASPILRGMAADSHLTKMAVHARGIPTAPWAISRRGAPATPEW